MFLYSGRPGGIYPTFPFSVTCPAFNDVLRSQCIKDYREVFTSQGLAMKAKDALAKAVLAELPNQVISYMSANGISPTRSCMPLWADIYVSRKSFQGSDFWVWRGVHFVAYWLPLLFFESVLLCKREATVTSVTLLLDWYKEDAMWDRLLNGGFWRCACGQNVVR
jgi:hypothetical protein